MFRTSRGVFLLKINSHLYNSAEVNNIGFKLKLWQLAVATLSIGTFIYSWLRWRMVKSEDSFPPTFVPSPFPFLAISWISWLTFTVIAWAIFGENLFWDLDHSLTPTSGKIGEGAKETQDVFEKSMSAMAIIITVVTGFYLLLLHRAQDIAYKELEGIRHSAAVELEPLRRFRFDYETLIGSNESLLQAMTRRNILFLQNTFLPTMANISMLANTQGEESQQHRQRIADSFCDIIRHLQAEIILFRLAESPNMEEFLVRWNDVNAYDDVYKTRDYSYLFRLAHERLERLQIGFQGHSKQRMQINEVKQTIRNYETPFSLHQEIG